MTAWLEEVAAEDPNKALDHMSKLAEYVYPKLARVEGTQKHEGEVIHKIERVIVDIKN